MPETRTRFAHLSDGFIHTYFRRSHQLPTDFIHVTNEQRFRAITVISIIENLFKHKAHDGPTQDTYGTEITVTSTLTISPSSNRLSSGIPWQATLFTDVHTDLGKPL